jgi:hypothetical protein
MTAEPLSDLASLPPPPNNPAGPAPLRRPESARRTSSIDMTWPNGQGKPSRFVARARDVVTGPQGGRPAVIADDRLYAMVSPERAILSIESDPVRRDLGSLVGVRGGDYLRSALNRALPAEREAGSPLYLLIDDLAGSSLISGWAWSRWTTDWMQRMAPGMSREERMQMRVLKMEGVCIGFQPGSSALGPTGDVQNFTPVGPLANPADPEGWHELAEHRDVSMRRARRIDVWRDGDIVIDSTFQDSASVPEGGRVAIHEYLLRVTVDPSTLKVKTAEADPRTVPYRECPTAVKNVGRMVGVPVKDLRQVVLLELRRTAGCTHLNDALRALAEVPALLRLLPAD